MAGNNGTPPPALRDGDEGELGRLPRRRLRPRLRGGAVVSVALPDTEPDDPAGPPLDALVMALHRVTRIRSPSHFGAAHDWVGYHAGRARRGGRQVDGDSQHGLSLHVEDQLLLVAGGPQEVDEYVDSLAARGIEWARAPEASINQEAAFALSAAVGLQGSTGEYVKLSPRSLDLLREHGAIPARNGYFRTMVKDRDTGRFAGNLEWQPVQMAGESALALQMLGVSAALMLAIKEVSAAVKEVEDKVDDVLALAHAQHVGDVLGRYKFLRDATLTPTRIPQRLNRRLGEVQRLTRRVYPERGTGPTVHLSGPGRPVGAPPRWTLADLGRDEEAIAVLRTRHCPRR